VIFASDSFTVSFDDTPDPALTLHRPGGKASLSINVPLKGFYQRRNLPGVLQAVDVLATDGWLIDDHAIKSGIEKVVTNTGLKGRWQILKLRPLTVCDTAHNVDGIREVVAQINAQAPENLYFIIGVVRDKDVSGIIKLLPKNARYYFCQANIPRAMDAHQLAALALSHGLRGEVVTNVNDAIRKATQEASVNDMIFIGGSTFVVGDIDAL
jgi:dihydrofolate synthase/folylpolyglutamate synthase